MSKVIIYTDSDGNLVELWPAPGLDPVVVANKDVPTGISYFIDDDSNLPGDDNFRSAWKENSGSVVVDMDLAKEIHKDNIRTVRKPLLERKDADYMKALESADTATQATVSAEKQSLRDATSDPDIDAATTPEELKAAWKTDLLGDSPYTS